jgi:hypothetical protein
LAGALVFYRKHRASPRADHLLSNLLRSFPRTISLVFGAFYFGMILVKTVVTMELGKSPDPEVEARDGLK